MKGGGYGLTNVVYDGSDGVHRLFVEGSKIGRDAELPLPGHRRRGARTGRRTSTGQQLGGNPNLTFTRLLIDPVGGGQNMYTIGAPATLWESHDGGGPGAKTTPRRIRDRDSGCRRPTVRCSRPV